MIDPLEVAERIDSFKQRTGVELVLVTKGFGATTWRAALSGGVAVGENYAQELLRKYDEVQPRPPVHFIGQLQRNKVKSLAGKVALWQSVDSPALMAEIAKRSPGDEVLVEVNLTEDEGRGGCSFGEVPELVVQGIDLGLKVTGLMAVGVPGEPENSRLPYRRLRGLADELRLTRLSIGMSGDWQIAVDEGSTMVRIGSAILGTREYPVKK